VIAKEVENYHNLNRENTIPIYAEGSKYYSLFEPLVNLMKIDCGDYLITTIGMDLNARSMLRKISLIHKQ